MLDDPRFQRPLRLVLVAFFGFLTLVLLALAPITALTSLPFALVTGGMAYGVGVRGPDDTTPEGAKWMIGIGLGLVVCVIGFFVLFAGKG
jgi:hypothetical protein